jgi:hypothetical protein
MQIMECLPEISVKSITKHLVNLTGLLMFYTKSCDKNADYGMSQRYQLKAFQKALLI